MSDMNNPQADFKPDVYPLMYWALAYGAIAGVALFLVYVLSNFLTLVWFPVFLVGLVYGGYRNYQKQRGAYYADQGVAAPAQATPMNEFKAAVSDVYRTSQDVINNQSTEAQQPVQEEVQQVQYQEQPVQYAEQPAQEEQLPPQQQPPVPPAVQ